MPKLHTRTELLLGKENLEKLRNKKVLIAGIGGVGGYVAENIARAGVGKITLLDKDVVANSNINRQLVALHSTVGMKKTQIMQDRILDIDPSIELDVIDDFMSTEKVPEFVNNSFDFIADCIDTIACKAQLVAYAQQLDIPIISSMGAGNRYKVNHVKVTTLDKTEKCPLAREMRRRIRKLNGNLNYPVIFSDEDPKPAYVENISNNNYREKAVNGTISYMPALFGVLMAGEIIRLLLEGETIIDDE